VCDGVWAWPERLEHYVDAHDVILPEAFVAACRSPPAPPDWLHEIAPQHWVQAGEGMVPMPGERPQALVDDTAWLDWAASRTPPRPHPDAISIGDAHAVCERLSHRAWRASVIERQQAPETVSKTMRALTSADFERYRERRRREGEIGARRARRGAGEITVNKELSFMRAVFNDFIAELEEKGEAPIPNPVRKRLFYEEPKDRNRYLKDDEERRLREVFPVAEWPKARVSMLTGLDRGTQFGLRWDKNVDLQTRMIVTERYKGRRKGATPVAVAINDELLGILRALPSRLSSPWVFPNAAGTGPLAGRWFDHYIWRPFAQTRQTG
jgi:hypothetical protein